MGDLKVDELYSHLSSTNYASLSFVCDGANRMSHLFLLLQLSPAPHLLSHDDVAAPRQGLGGVK